MTMNRNSLRGMLAPILTAGMIFLCAIVSVSMAFAQSASDKPALAGHWSSAAPEPYGTIFATRSFVMTDRTWVIAYRAYADREARQPLFRLDVGGTYVLGGVSQTVKGAYEGIFPADHRHITAESEAGVRLFAGMGCVLEAGREIPLVGEGCGFVPGLMQAMGEYDLVAMIDGQLFFGDRAGDLTKTRPTQLTPYPLLRR